MKFKEFVEWCNQRACDGCWGFIEAVTCTDLITKVRKIPFFIREKYWKREYEESVLNEIVNPINEKIKEMNYNKMAN